MLQESIEFRQTALEATLQLVYSIIWELKTHEIIENTVIMQVNARSEKRYNYGQLQVGGYSFTENRERECLVGKYNTQRRIQL